MKVDFTKTRFEADDIQLGIGSDVTLDTTEFDQALSSADDTSQKAFETLDRLLGYLFPDNAESLHGKVLNIGLTTQYTGKLSAGNANYKAGDPAGSTVDYIIKDATFQVSTPDTSTCFNYADTGTLKLMVNTVQVDVVDLAANFVEGEREGAQTTTPWLGAGGDVNVYSVEAYNNFPSWQKGNALAYINPGDLQQGYNEIYFERDGTPTTQTSGKRDFFYDNDAGADPSCTVPTVVENTKVSKFLSGIEFYYRASWFNVTVTASDCFDNVYHQTSPLTYTSTNGTMSSGVIVETDPTVTGLSSPPAIGETMVVTNKVLVVPNSNVRSTNSRVTITPRDPYGSYTGQQSLAENRLVDAYANTSTTQNEYFDDENYRMPAGAYDSIPGSITGQWTSSALLTNGSAQVFNGSLYFPTIDFSSGYLPSQAGGANYSTFSGNQVYYRAFQDSGDPHNSGQLEFGGLTGSDIDQVGSGNVNVEIKLPTQSGWLDLGKPFDAGTFTGIDGDGCQVTQSGDDWSWTCGTLSTANSGYMIMVRVTLRNSTRSITQIRELGW